MANPVDTGRKLNVHKTFRICPGRPLNVLCTFNLRPVSTEKQLFKDSKKDSSTTAEDAFVVSSSSSIKKNNIYQKIILSKRF